MRKALLVGIDDYASGTLTGCVNDAAKMCELLSRHQDETPNFDCRPMLSPPSGTRITRPALRAAIDDLFATETEVSLFFFAGHGTVNNLGGYLVTQDATKYDEGVPMSNVLSLANNSRAREIVILLDCCHSGALGHVPRVDNESAIVREGVSVLTACRKSEPAVERGGGGLFTSLVCDALAGGGADVCGKVTVASVYAYVDAALGAWDQRPLFKSHVSKLVSLRNCHAHVPYDILRLLPKYFSSPTEDYALDPSYESSVDPRDPEHEKIFGHMQLYRDGRLLTPVGAQHLYDAAINSKGCRLTSLGRFYWRLGKIGKL